MLGPRALGLWRVTSGAHWRYMGCGDCLRQWASEGVEWYREGRWAALRDGLLAGWPHFSTHTFSIQRTLIPIFAFALLTFLTGCVSTGGKFVSTDRPRASSYLASAGVTNAQNRIEAQLAESSQKRRERVFWGGVAVAGGDQESQDALPLCANRNLLHEFEQSVGEKLRSVNPPHFDLQNTGAGPARADNWRDQDALVMMLVLVSEDRFCQPDPAMPEKYRVIIKITGQLLFLDTSKNMQVTASYPLAVAQRNLTTTPPGEAEFAELAKQALMSEQRMPDGKAASLRDQLLDQLTGRTIVPRAWRQPVAVGGVSLSAACRKVDVPGGSQELPESLLARWSAQFANTFVEYLGTGSGLAVNPYMAEGQSAVARDRALSAAASLTMRTTDRKMLNASLKPPRMVFNLEIDQLTCSMNQRSTMFLNIMDYGFAGKLTVMNPDTGATFLSLPLQIPAPDSSKLPRPLLQKYAGISAVKLLKETVEKGQVDHAYWWQESIDGYLLQLAREIAFEEEDLGHRFTRLRGELKRSLNASLDRPPAIAPGTIPL